MYDTSWSLSGPPRTLTRSVLMLTNRGTGRPLLAASLPAHVGPTANANVSSAADRARNLAIISLPCRSFATACPSARPRTLGRIAPGTLGESAAHLVEPHR